MIEPCATPECSEPGEFRLVFDVDSGLVVEGRDAGLTYVEGGWFCRTCAALLVEREASSFGYEDAVLALLSPEAAASLPRRGQR